MIVTFTVEVVDANASTLDDLHTAMKERELMALHTQANVHALKIMGMHVIYAEDTQ